MAALVSALGVFAGASAILALVAIAAAVLLFLVATRVRLMRIPAAAFACAGAIWALMAVGFQWMVSALAGR